MEKKKTPEGVVLKLKIAEKNAATKGIKNLTNVSVEWCQPKDNL